MLHGRGLPAALAITIGAVALLAGSFLAAQDEGHKKEGSKNKEGPPKCDLAKVETVQRCGDCGSDMDSNKCRCGKSKDCQCKEKKHEVAVCVKVYYECSACQNKQFKGGKCAKCEKCKNALVRTCKKSGEFPHVVPK